MIDTGVYGHCVCVCLCVQFFRRKVVEVIICNVEAATWYQKWAESSQIGKFETLQLSLFTISQSPNKSGFPCTR